MKITTPLMVRIDPKLKRDLDRLVKRNGSTIQVEVAVALAEHLEIATKREPPLAE